MNGTEAEAPDLRDYLRLLRRRGWILLLCVILIPGGVYLYANGLPKVFESSAVLQVQSTAADGPLLTGASDFALPSQNIQAVARFVSTSAVSDEAARRLNEPRGALFGAATATADEETGFITITATAPTAQRSADVANAFAAALSSAREKRARKRVDEAIELVERDLKGIGNSDPGARSQLTLQLQRLNTLRTAQAQNATVLEPAVAGSQIAPNPGRNATVALILAMLVGAGLMVLAERMDRRLRKPDELERLSGESLLGSIPGSAFSGESADAHVTEAFQTLRASLTYFNVDEPLTTVAVTSALKGEGKTTVATNLAIAYARSGKQVIVVDADLRKPDLARRFGLEDSAGVSEVLVGEVGLEEALRQVPSVGPELRLLPAGLVRPNPSALLGSARMSTLLEALAQEADLVIIDTTPLLVVSDAFPLLDQVSGVVALARINSTRRDAVRRMLQIIGTAGGRLLGVVATGTASASRYGEGYGYGYGYEGEASPGAPRFETPMAHASGSNGDDPVLTEEPARRGLFPRR